MDLQDRITVSAADIMRRLEQNLDKLRRFQYDRQYRELLGDTLISHLEYWDNQIRSRKNDPFTIVVAGEFKRGKSSLINALLGEDVMATDVVPETVTMNKLSFGMHKNEAVLSGGRRLALGDDELSRAELEKLMEETGEPIRQLELWRTNEWLRDIRIIDTPGLNDVHDDYLDNIVADAMAQADAVIYVYSVSSPLSRSEQMYIRYVILPQHYTKLFLVGNYGDLLRNSKELDSVRSLLGKRTEMLLSGEKTYLISALNEMCRIMGKDFPRQEHTAELEHDFDELRKDIAELIRQKKNIVASDRMLRMTRQMLEEVNADIANIEKGLEMTADQIAMERKNLQDEEARHNQKLEAAKANMHGTVSAMKDEAKVWIRDLLKRMEYENLDNYSVQEISQYYAYYCVELLETGVRTCIEMHREDLLEKMSDISDELGKGLAGMYAAEDNVRFCFRINNKTWTRGDSVTMAISMLTNNSAVSALADFVGSMTRTAELNDAGEKEKLLSDIRDKYRVLEKDAMKQIESQYADLDNSACALIEEYYQGQLQRAGETVAQYEEASQKRDEDKRQVTLAVVELRKILDTFGEEGI